MEGIEDNTSVSPL